MNVSAVYLANLLMNFLVAWSTQTGVVTRANLMGYAAMKVRHVLMELANVCLVLLPLMFLVVLLHEMAAEFLVLTKVLCVLLETSAFKVSAFPGLVILIITTQMTGVTVNAVLTTQVQFVINFCAQFSRLSQPSR